MEVGWHKRIIVDIKAEEYIIYDGDIDGSGDSDFSRFYLFIYYCCIQDEYTCSLTQNTRVPVSWNINIGVFGHIWQIGLFFLVHRLRMGDGPLLKYSVSRYFGLTNVQFLSILWRYQTTKSQIPKYFWIEILWHMIAKHAFIYYLPRRWPIEKQSSICIISA